MKNENITVGITLSIWSVIEFILVHNGGFHLSVDRDDKKIRTIQLTLSLATKELSDEQIKDLDRNLCQFCQVHGVKGSDGFALMMIKRERTVDEKGNNVIELVWD